MAAMWEKDYYRMTGSIYKRGIKSFITVLMSHQIRYVRLWREAKQHSNLLNKLRLHRMSKRYGLEILSRAQIGSGLYLGHAYNITVAGGAVIGNNVNLHKGCTIGAENRGKRQGCPVLGNRVYVGINSTIVGNVHIGDDVLIAGNTFVNFDVPDHSVVIGNPASVHSKDNATEGYIAFSVEEEVK